ncbi:hypothetical protein CANMA_003032 [Candida margitis]|uniref:uncharacterized protein n=1 Tax=Candida margitis TaxID=1775924 RepID=UPI002226C68A|nr:uncharacterized protein CANMA_003032 [Candida margitis]KAI5967486.1 hypothetical protein CANMA_003032 [Candida margitis]
MVDLGLISKHYELREKVSSVLQEDDERKNLIKLSILRLAILKQGDETRIKKSTRGSSKKAAAAKSPTKDYEIELNKLKQEFSTKSKLQDAKLQSLKQENERLKDQVKKLHSDSSSSSTSIFQTRKRVLPSHRSIFSPEKSILVSSKAATFRHSFPTIFDDELITPIKKIPETKLASDVMKSGSTFSPSKDSKLQETRVFVDGLVNHSATSSPTGSSKFRSPTKFVKNFDNENSNDEQSTHKRSPSPEFTPNRRRRVLRSTDSSAVSDEKLESTPSATNGNETVEHSGSPIRAKRKIKKVKKKKTLELPSSGLIKSEKLKMAFPEVDDDNLNTLAKYEDAHFEENDAAPDTSSNPLKRKMDVTEQVLDPEPPKKKRNVFTID